MSRKLLAHEKAVLVAEDDRISCYQDGHLHVQSQSLSGTTGDGCGKDAGGA